MAKPLLTITEVRSFLELATRFVHISGGILSHSSLQILSKSLRFRGWRLATRTFSSLHRFSMGLRSGDWLGHSRTLMCFFWSHSFVALAVCFGSLSCWNTHPRLEPCTGLKFRPIARPWPETLRHLARPVSNSLSEFLARVRPEPVFFFFSFSQNSLYDCFSY